MGKSLLIDLSLVGILAGLIIVAGIYGVVSVLSHPKATQSCIPVATHRTLSI